MSLRKSFTSSLCACLCAFHKNQSRSNDSVIIRIHNRRHWTRFRGGGTKDDTASAHTSMVSLRMIICEAQALPDRFNSEVEFLGISSPGGSDNSCGCIKSDSEKFRCSVVLINSQIAERISTASFPAIWLWPITTLSFLRVI